MLILIIFLVFAGFLAAFLLYEDYILSKSPPKNNNDLCIHLTEREVEDLIRTAFNRGKQFSFRILKPENMTKNAVKLQEKELEELLKEFSDSYKIEQ